MVSCVRGAQGVVCIRQEGGVWFALGRRGVVCIRLEGGVWFALGWREGCGLH